MKKSLKIIGLIVFTLILGSCSTERLVGDWDDNIKLSTKTVHFDKNKNATTITTKGEWWWINGLIVNGEHFQPSKDQEDIDLTSDSYAFKGDWFTVEKKNKTTLYIEVDENNTVAKRNIVVTLQAGNYFDGVTITQQAE